MSDELTDLQAAIKTFLDAQEYFSNSEGTPPKPIPVVTEDQKDIATHINTVVGQATGMLVLVYSPGGKVKNADAFGVTFEPCTVMCRVYEKPTINRATNGTGQPGRNVAIAIGKLLNGETLPGFNGPLVCMEVGPGKDEKFQCHDVFFELTVPLSSTAPTRI